MTEQDLPSTTKRQAFWSFLVRWQDWSGWLPVCVALALVAFTVLPGFDRTAGRDTLPILAVLPIKIAYAIAACGVLHLVRRRWRLKLDDRQQYRLREFLSGEAYAEPSRLLGPLALYFGDLVFTLCALFLLLRFFSLPA